MATRLASAVVVAPQIKKLHELRCCQIDILGARDSGTPSAIANGHVRDREQGHPARSQPPTAGRARALRGAARRDAQGGARRRRPAMRWNEIATWILIAIFVGVVGWYGLHLQLPHH